MSRNYRVSQWSHVKWNQRRICNCNHTCYIIWNRHEISRMVYICVRRSLKPLEISLNTEVTAEIISPGKNNTHKKNSTLKNSFGPASIKHVNRWKIYHLHLPWEIIAECSTDKKYLSFSFFPPYDVLTWSQIPCGLTRNIRCKLLPWLQKYYLFFVQQILVRLVIRWMQNHFAEPVFLFLNRKV